MNCNSCGAPLQPGEKYCTSCGAGVPQTNQQTTNYGDQYQQPRQQASQPRYQQQTVVYPSYQPEYHEDEHVSTWGWIGRWILTAIPIVNVIMLFVWSFGSSKKRSLQTWARAQLLLVLICIVLLAIFVIVMIAMGYSINDITRTMNRG